MKTIEEFIEAYKKADYWWEPLDRIILRACTEYPEHTTVGEVHAKVALINGVYRANLQMAVTNAERSVAERLVDKKIDTFVRALRGLRTLDRGTLGSVVHVHEELVCVVREVTGRVENSFCAKYLGFHFQDVVPVFDTYAFNSSWRLIGRHLPKGLFDGNWNADYAYHCEAVVGLMERLHEAGVANPKLKLIDVVLYGSR